MSADETSCEIVYCHVCANAIPSTAKKCTRCSSYQRGLLKVLPVTDASLSVVLALISVLTVIVPPIVKWMSRESLTRVAIVTAESDKDLQIAVSNVGRRPTVLRSYHVEFLEAPFLPSQTLVPRNTQNALLMPEKDATILLTGAAKVFLPDTKEERAKVERWIETGTVKLTACVKESGSGVTKANLLAPAGSCERIGLVTRSDMIEARHLTEWIKGVVEWKTKSEPSPLLSQ